MTDEEFIGEALERNLVLKILTSALEHTNVSTDDVTAELRHMCWHPLDSVTDEEIKTAYREMCPKVIDWSEVIRQSSRVSNNCGTIFTLLDEVRLLREEFAKLGLYTHCAIEGELL